MLANRTTLARMHELLRRRARHPQTTRHTHGYHLGMASRTELLPEEARALLRHAYNHFYHDFANVDLKNKAFHWELTYANALQSFRNAVYRYGMHFKILFNTRMHSTLQGAAPQEARDKYPNLIDIELEGEFAGSRASGANRKGRDCKQSPAARQPPRLNPQSL